MVDPTSTVTPLEGAETEALLPQAEQSAVLETENGVYVFVPVEANAAEMSAYLQDINVQWLQAQKPELFESLTKDHQVVFFSNETIETEVEIQDLLRTLELPDPTQKEVDKAKADSKPMPPQKEVHKSLFSLARSVHQSESRVQKQVRTEAKPQAREANSFVSTTTSKKSEEARGFKFLPKDKDKDDNPKDQQQDKKKWQASVGKASSKAKGVAATQDAAGNVFVRFMHLMARILGQAEAEAHQLYTKIKARTDDVDTLTLLTQKINTANGEINWQENEEMENLLKRAREIGVEIPEGKLTWSEDEKRLFKENVQMRKDSMEKMTQLERTDMQRYLQEASQCHQARSNVLKLLKEVMDTIIHNMRP